MTNINDESLTSKNALYILGAGFSAAAGLPLADALWEEVCRRALPMTGRAGKFKKDLNDYIEFKRKCEGKRISRKDINFEEFLGHLDIEHFLGLRGGDTWSEDGNESQIIVKVLIGQILSEMMPDKKCVPQLYIDFARKLGPGDRVITFNYDVLLERACEAAGKPYRLVPTKYTSAFKEGGLVDLDSYDEISILKLHGSIDWFNKKGFRVRQEDAIGQGYSSHVPSDPIFNSGGKYQPMPLHTGPCPHNESLKEVYKIDNFQHFYQNPPLFLTTPSLISPSTSKIVYASDFHDLWRGKGRDGGYGFRMVIIGYSLPLHDDYARQVIYRLVTNYQQIPAKRIHPSRKKEPLIIVDLCRSAAEKISFKKRYQFVNWAKAKTYFNGFNSDVINIL